MQQGRWLLPDDARVLIASDMHVGMHDPDTASYFLRALDNEAGTCSHLLLLGDLFEAWPGDDQQDPVANRLVDALAALHMAGTKLAVMRGNRDFLLDVPVPNTAAPSFSERTGATMLGDSCTLQLGSLCCLLMHGDTLCTGDVQYQQVREMCRAEAWQRNFLDHSLQQRVAQARQYRQDSQQAYREKQSSGANDLTITDVAQAAVDRALQNAGCNLLIHGHTHRPAVHRWHQGGQARCRHVLPDWHAGSAGSDARGGFLRLTRHGVDTVTC